MTPNTLQISEKFFSIQGEGWTTGVPAYFIRLTGCNLSCGLGSKGLIELSKHLKTLSKDEYRAGGFDHQFANLFKDNKATWVCDSASVWLRGSETHYEDIVNDWKKEKIFEWIKENRTHIIWTGGEPTLPNHQKSICEFLDWLYVKHEIKAFNEIETNGTVPITSELLNHLDQINCSVKLANSGMTKSRRINPEAINSIMSHDNYWFKFVISSEEDLKEINSDFIESFNIPGDRIIIMPGLDRQEDLFERTKMTLELAKKYGFIGTTRLHVAGWGSVTGV